MWCRRSLIRMRRSLIVRESWKLELCRLYSTVDMYFHIFFFVIYVQIFCKKVIIPCIDKYTYGTSLTVSSRQEDQASLSPSLSPPPITEIIKVWIKQFENVTSIIIIIIVMIITTIEWMQAEQYQRNIKISTVRNPNWAKIQILMLNSMGNTLLWQSYTKSENYDSAHKI